MSDVGLPDSTAYALLAFLIAIPVVTFIAAFLIGSIPFGYLIGRFFYHIDIRKQGSGNIGAMNALRTMGRSGAAAVLLLDALKGFAPALFALVFFKGIWTKRAGPQANRYSHRSLRPGRCSVTVSPPGCGSRAAKVLPRRSARFSRSVGRPVSSRWPVGSSERRSHATRRSARFSAACSPPRRSGLLPVRCPKRRTGYSRCC